MSNTFAGRRESATVAIARLRRIHPRMAKELKQQQEGVVIPAGLALLVIFVTASEVDHGAPLADRRGRGACGAHTSQCAAAQHG